MGLLDDAIREHLELKRRRGADPHDVERQEQEALGPPLGGEFASTPGAPEATEPPAAVAATDAEPEPEPVEPEPVAPEDDAPGDLEGWLDEPREEPVQPSTTEFTPDDVEPLPEDSAGEDVLEETPEFLQETPEHDRLWFEQKPPRDFDLDR